jgi:hypothetical protein
MTLWKNLCDSDSIEMFVNMSKFVQENVYESEEIKPQVLTRLTNLEYNFKSCFSDLTLSQHEWIRYPLAVKISYKISHLSVKSQEILYGPCL